MSSTNFRSILIFASCVVGTRNILYMWVIFIVCGVGVYCDAMSAERGTAARTACKRRQLATGLSGVVLGTTLEGAHFSNFQNTYQV